MVASLAAEEDGSERERARGSEGEGGGGAGSTLAPGGHGDGGREVEAQRTNEQEGRHHCGSFQVRDEGPPPAYHSLTHSLALRWGSGSGGASRAALVWGRAGRQHCSNSSPQSTAPKFTLIVFTEWLVFISIHRKLLFIIHL
jgi:hypothetical protein